MFPTALGSAFLVLGVCLSITLFFWSESKRWAERQLRADFEYRTRAAIGRIEERMKTCEEVLRGVRALFYSSNQVTRSEFRTYVAQLSLETVYPGIQGVGFSMVIPAAKLKGHIAKTRSEGFPEYTLWPAGAREKYTSIIFLEPFRGRNLRAFGYDMFSESVRRNAMELARDDDRPVLSGKVRLVQETEKDVQAGALLFLPIFRTENSNRSVAERRRDLIGWAYSPFRMDDLLRGLHGEREQDLGIRIFDGKSELPDFLLYGSSPAGRQTPRFLSRSLITVAERPWTVTLASTPTFESYVRIGKSKMILLLGTCLSLLTSALMFFLINGRVLAVRLAEERETRFKHLMQHANDAIFLAGADRKMMETNRGAEQLFGYSQEDFKEMRIEDLSPSIAASVAIERFQYLLANGRDEFEALYKRKDGSTFWGQLSVSASIFGKERILFGVMRDITARKKAEEQIAHLASFPERNPNPIIETDYSRNITFTNPASREIINGLGLEDAKEFLPSDFADLILHFQKDSNMVFQRDVRIKDRIFAESISSPAGFSLVRIFANDVTDFRRAEEHLRRSQKLEVLGQMAGGVVHEFNNILTAIMGSTDFLAEEMDKENPLQKELIVIQASAKRAALLTRQLLTFSQRQIVQPVPLDLNDIVSNAQMTLSRLLGEQVALILVPASELGFVTIDSDQLNQAITNLAMNARDAMPRGGELILETRDVVFCEDDPVRPKYVPAGRYVMLTMTDNGVGMDLKAQEHVFEPFFTTKEVGKGTGLGLPAVYGIITQAKGYLWLDSQIGKGTSVHILLPPAAVPPPAVVGKRISNVSPGGTETILVVEDEPSVRHPIVRALQNVHYTVLEAADGDEAFQILKRTEDLRIDLMITDVVMPHMGGVRLAKTAQYLRPAMKVLFVSGYAPNSDSPGPSTKDSAFLQKPFTPMELAQAVRHLLDPGTAS